MIIKKKADISFACKLPNSFGLFDMHGNVWEWCEDWYHPTYEGAPTDGSAWLSGGEQKFRVLRAGSWQDDAGLLPSAYRYAIVPNFGGNAASAFGWSQLCGVSNQ